ncbi:MobF family relaxase [Pseudoalteromonas sp. Angola-4]|uniref:MobF family relaxase n=1 Tax=Pseudoalteromonas sp. Angola-4 TaxID=3025335 RepID=UPI002358AC32|nr:MobF family relaxase [Pseudoalteromonas sp. Angola-4]MDC9510114.1 MobF family relaxase [Pseudoalteromonas sp. Angola-4]
MISISKQSRLNYYIENDHQTNMKPLDILYTGAVSKALNFKPKMYFNELKNIFSGCDIHGKQLIGSVKSKKVEILDIVFNAPKPISKAFVRVDDLFQKRIDEAQFQAVLGALEFLELKVSFTRTGQGGKNLKKTKGFAALLFKHYESREGDFHLHTHALLSRLTLREDGKWASLHSHLIYRWQKAAVQVYRALLASSLRELGFKIIRVNETDCFTFSGSNLDICRLFSKRSEGINNKLEEMGLEGSSPEVKNKVSLYSRKPKQKKILASQINTWRMALNELGYTEEELYKNLNTENVPTIEALPVVLIIKKLTQSNAIVDIRKIYEITATEAQFFHVNLSEILNTVEAILNNTRLLGPVINSTGQEIYTTKPMLRFENELVGLTDLLRSNSNYRLSENVIKQAISKQELEQGFKLSSEQSCSIQKLTSTGLEILQGRAGAGKSTSMKALRIAYELSGYKLVGATVSKAAATQLEAETGINSCTFEKLLIEIKHKNNKFTNTVILIDEAGLVPSLDLLALLKEIKRSGSKLVLVGEVEQLRAINHGGCLLYLSKRYGFTELQTIYRQRENWAKSLVTVLRSGDSIKALKIMIAKGLLHIAETRELALERLIKRWSIYVDTNPKKDWLVIAYSWKDIQPLNEFIRSELQQRGLLGEEDIKANCVVSERYFLQKFSSHDRVRFTKNTPERNLINGQLGIIKEVKAINSDILFTIKKDSGEEVTFLKSEYSNEQGALQLVHAYAFTVYSSQGRTIDGDTFVFYNKAMDRAASYVAGSRHKDRCHWFVDGNSLDVQNALDAVNEKVQNQNPIKVKRLAEYMSSERSEVMALEYWNNTA